MAGRFGSDGKGKYGTSTNIKFTRNSFSRKFFKNGGSFGPVTAFENGPGNVWSDIWESSTVELRRITGKSAQQFFDETVAKHPLGRAQTGEDVGAATVFLCSGAARNVTGEALYVTGGL